MLHLPKSSTVTYGTFLPFLVLYSHLYSVDSVFAGNIKINLTSSSFLYSLDLNANLDEDKREDKALFINTISTFVV